MNGLKQGGIILLLLCVVTWIYKWREGQSTRIPVRISDRIRLAVNKIAAGLLNGLASASQNPLINLLKLTEDENYLTQLRQSFTDEELAAMTQMDVVSLSNVLKTEQNKAYQRIAYFLPQQLGYEAYMQWYFPQTKLPVLQTAQPQIPTMQQPTMQQPASGAWHLFPTQTQTQPQVATQTQTQPSPTTTTTPD